jgi:hypothetical protein
MNSMACTAKGMIQIRPTHHTPNERTNLLLRPDSCVVCNVRCTHVQWYRYVVLAQRGRVRTVPRKLHVSDYYNTIRGRNFNDPFDIVEAIIWP